MRAIVVALASILLPVATLADVVYLKGGGSLRGTVVEHTATRITIDVAAGRLTVPATRVERVAAGRSALVAYNERAERLRADDVAGWLALALWARDAGLATQARRAFEHVVALDPGNAQAQQALGNVLEGDRWVSSDEAYRLRGYVLFEGRWVTPAERDGRLAERRAELEMEGLRAARDAEIAEAEARAAAAEAQAAEARAAADSPEVVIGSISPYGAAGYGYGRRRPYVSESEGRCARGRRTDRQAAQSAPSVPSFGGPRTTAQPRTAPRQVRKAVAPRASGHAARRVHPDRRRER